MLSFLFEEAAEKEKYKQAMPICAKPECREIGYKTDILCTCTATRSSVGAHRWGSYLVFMIRMPHLKLHRFMRFVNLITRVTLDKHRLSRCALGARLSHAISGTVRCFLIPDRKIKEHIGKWLRTPLSIDHQSRARTVQFPRSWVAYVLLYKCTIIRTFQDEPKILVMEVAERKIH